MAFEAIALFWHAMPVQVLCAGKQPHRPVRQFAQNQVRVVRALVSDGDVGFTPGQVDDLGGAVQDDTDIRMLKVQRLQRRDDKVVGQ
ncbi:hypothetical protein D3C81_1977750 [compost metagenome]